MMARGGILLRPGSDSSVPCNLLNYFTSFVLPFQILIVCVFKRQLENNDLVPQTNPGTQKLSYASAAQGPK